ncbi:MAG: hypothetical protein KDA45_03490, partial [Planctomycetales bacterium]|nr:hypothetical protein [Planctomycetales bacterium]
ERARAGNQSPLFFFPLFAVNETLGRWSSVPLEGPLRLPAIVSWGLCVALCVWIAAQHLSRAARGAAAGWSGGWLVLSLLGWLLLDRIQLFYATEARVYGLLQLLSLLAWYHLGRAAALGSPEGLLEFGGQAERSAVVTRAAGRRLALWCLLGCLLVQLHVIAALAVAWQVMWGTLLLRRREPALRRRWGLAVAVVSLAAGIAILFSRDIWDHRQQWQSFAGEATLTSLLQLFPFAAFAVPLLVARVLDGCCRDARSQTAQVPPTAAGQGRSEALGQGLAPRLGRLRDLGRRSGICFSLRGWSMLWLVAAAGPWLTAWLVTASGLAPIFHRRYVIVSALPLALWAASELTRLRSSRLRAAAVVGVMAWLIVSQGTWSAWRQGQWLGWQRVEGWREATAWIQQEWQEADEIWCASNLIEGQRAELPLSAQQNEYLSFPLRGAYAIRNAAGRRVEPQALVGDAGLWPRQLAAAAFEPTATSVTSRGGPISGRRVWIVYRGQPQALERKLHDLPELFAEPRAFGQVSVARGSIPADSTHPADNL